MDRKTRGRRNVEGNVNRGSDYSPDELEFMMAMDRYKRERRRPYPTWQEVLAVARSLGYRKEGAGEKDA